MIGQPVSLAVRINQETEGTHLETTLSLGQVSEMSVLQNLLSIQSATTNQ